MEVIPDYYMCEIDDVDYDDTLRSNTRKFFDNFTEARLWLSEACVGKARTLLERGVFLGKRKSLYGKLYHYHAGEIISHYTWNGYHHMEDTGDYQLECDNLYDMGYPKNNGFDRGNLIALLHQDEKEWLMEYLNPNNSENVFHYDYRHRRVWDILNGKYAWNEKRRTWGDFE